MVGGFALLSKWLSYRVGSDLTSDDLDAFTTLARRVVCIQQLQPRCDEFYEAARHRRLEPPGQAAGAVATISPT